MQPRLALNSVLPPLYPTCWDYRCEANAQQKHAFPPTQALGCHIELILDLPVWYALWVAKPSLGDVQDETSPVGLRLENIW